MTLWHIQSNLSPSLETRQRVENALDRVLSRRDLGFKNEGEMADSLRVVLEQTHHLDDYDSLVVLGLGGSSLGTKAFYNAIPELQKRPVFFLDNVDAHTIDRWINNCKFPEKCAWILCSKSGSTIEVLSLFEYLDSAFQSLGLPSLVAHTFVITEDQSNPLRDFARRHQRPHFVVPINVGGRFSVFTPVGLFPLHHLGLDTSAVLKGVSWVLKNPQVVQTLTALLYESHERGELNFYSFQYADRLQTWGLWLQQLWSESLAKKVTRSHHPAPINSTFVPCRGVSDQHSVLQQVMEGLEKKMVLFHRVTSSEKGRFTIHQNHFGDALLLHKSIGELHQAEAVATEKALNEIGLNTIRLTTNDIDAQSLSALMMLWMLAVATMGELFDINAFDQPGVESGKRIARRVLSDSH